MRRLVSFANGQAQTALLTENNGNTYGLCVFLEAVLAATIASNSLSQAVSSHRCYNHSRLFVYTLPEKLAMESDFSGNHMTAGH